MKKAKSIISIAAGMLVLVLTITLSCTNTAETVSVLSTDSLDVAQDAMKTLVDEGKLSCVAALVMKDGKVVRKFAYGMAHIEEDRKLTDNSIFRIYSMSKPITAAALMILYDEGKFQLDDPVAEYIPAFKDTKVYVDGELVDQQEAFTIRHLLTHTAGFTYGWDQGSHVDSLYSAMGSGGIWATKTLEDMVNLVATLPLKYQPGTTYEYSISIDVAGYLVEVLSGETFDQFLRARLFEPLGMDDTGFEVPEEDYDRLAMIYTKNEESGELAPVANMTNGVKQKVTLFSGGGGLVSTLDDYRKFGQMLLNGGELNGVRILQKSTIELIMSDQMPEAVEYDGGYGLGGYVDLEDGSYGWSGAASTDFVANPSNQMVILSFTQYIPFMGVPFADQYKKLVGKALDK